MQIQINTNRLKNKKKYYKIEYRLNQKKQKKSKMFNKQKYKIEKN